MLNILVVSDSGKDTYSYKYDKVTYISLGVKNSFFIRVLYRALYMTGLVYLFYLFKFSDIDFKAFDVVLLNETRFPVKLIKFLAKRNRCGTVLYWLWNTVGKTSNPRFFDNKAEFRNLLNNRSKYGYTIVSFDYHDCQKFDFVYNAQCVPLLDTNDMPRNIKSDIFFVGQDKDRIETLMKLYKTFEDQGLKCDFYVFPQKDKKYTPEEEDFIYKGQLLTYDQVIKHDLESKAILDIVQDGQGGLTWRPIESIYYNVKLITNYKRIRYQDFYNNENIFILGEDDINKLKDFLNSPFRSSSSDEKERYTLNGAIENIIKEISGNK